VFLSPVGYGPKFFKTLVLRVGNRPAAENPITLRAGWEARLESRSLGSLRLFLFARGGIQRRPMRFLHSETWDFAGAVKC
jgi:hypothetical protein